MQNTTKTGWLANGTIAVLTILLVVQFAYLGVTRLGTSANPVTEFAQLGDVVTTLRAIDDSVVTEILIADVGGPVILLAFHSECPHCEAIAPDWRAWLAKGPPTRVLAISRDTLAVGLNYAETHGWKVPVVSVGAEPDEPEAGLTRRTPWIYVIDRHGIVRFEGHGSRLGALDSVLTVQGAP